MPADLHTGDYLAEWRVIDSLEQQGLFKSALERTEALYNRAKTDKNGQQVVKTVIYRGKFTTMLEEDGLVRAIRLFEDEIKTAAPVEKAVLQSMLAEIYATYLQNQGYSIRQRTPIPDGEGGDVLTWSADRMEREALTLYQASLQPEALLRQTPAEAIRDITTPSRGDTATAPLRPTLYDFLAHRALQHFSNERSYLTEPAYKFYLDQLVAFAPAAEFVRATFNTQDTTSGKWLAIRLFQKLLAQHLGDADPSALIDVDLLRLQFVRNNAVMEDKLNLYERALEYIHKQHYDHPSDAEIVYQLALLLVEKDQREVEAKSSLNHLKRAVTEAEDAIRRHPNSYGARQNRQLVNEIRSHQLQVVTEQTNLPDRPLLTSVMTKNLSAIWVKVVALDRDPQVFAQMEYQQRLPYLNGRPALQSKQWAIPDPADFRHHRGEIALEPLGLGYYAVLVSDNAAFSPKQGIVSFATFTCSNLAAVPFGENNTTHLYMVHRQSGAPLSGVKVDLFQRNYDQPKPNFLNSSTSDASGLVRPAPGANRYNVNLRASLGADTLWLGERFYFGEASSREPRVPRTVQFFTDRSLYRPGQTVYFKGLLLDHRADRRPQIVPNQAVTAVFYDANGQEKGQLQLRTNEYGTFNGSFPAPAGGLTGRMSIRLREVNGIAQFNVEEYKRPKFEVAFKPVETAFRLNEKVTVRGNAKAYAGSSIGGAQVRYRVVRQARFPFFDYAWYRLPFPTTSMEIANGLTTTDDNGDFTVAFDLLPDRSIPEKNQPVFDYVVYADVTDITGETRSSQMSLAAGYIGLQVDLGLTADMEIDSLRRVRLETKNLAGRPQPAQGTIDIQRLVEPRTFYKNRFWDKPDLRILSEQEFKRLFPDYAFGDEDQPDKWDREDNTRTVNFDTARDSTVDLHGGRMSAGYYAVTLKTKDPYGKELEIKRIVHVWDDQNPPTRFYEPSAIVERPSLEPGQTARIWLGGKPAPLNVFFAREADRRLSGQRWLTVNGAEKIDIPVTEADRGGMAAYWFTVHGNRLYGAQPLQIFVPWSNKDLSISYETFRDKLQPGQKEEWRLRISGPKKEKVAAEMVAALYDASLDQFLPHGWGGIGYPANYPTVNFMPWAAGFDAGGGEVFYDPPAGVPAPERYYRALNWFNFPLYGGHRLMLESMATGGAPGRGRQRDGMPAPTAAQAKEREEGDMAKREDNAAANEVAADSNQSAEPSAPPQPPAPPPLRRNLSETVFFFPELRTDAQGDIVLKFTMNEALTRWKLLTFAHTKDLEFGLSTRETVTQKELMILTNPPRFLREGDEMEFTAKVTNLSQGALSGKATLRLLDAATLQPVDQAFGLATADLPFTVAPGQSAPVAWKIRVPQGAADGLTWQVFAESGAFRDGEENTLPVVTNRMLVTETLPITVRGQQTKSFAFENLRENKSSTLQSHRYTLEFTSNPAWYAVQSLPYLMEFPFECSEQIFSRFYANTLAASVTTKLPQLRRVYDRWKTAGGTALKSNLSKNQELKSALLEETPWVLEAQSEEQQKQNIALLFDLNRMSDEQDRAIAQLARLQSGSGGFPWFAGGREDWYITQHIAVGFGHLKQLGAYDATSDGQTSQMVDRALGFCERRAEEHYKEIEKAVQNNKTKFEDDHLDGLLIHYLYARSFFPVDRPGRIQAYYLDQASRHWLGKGLYHEGMLALALHRAGRTADAQKIVASLRERALVKEELGMYWPFDWGYYWYQLPVETQALMVEVFDEVANDRKAVEELRIWLLKNKQTNRWESTKATAEAVYALLLHGDNWLQNSQPVQVSLGGKTLKPAEYEPGTGYFKQAWEQEAVQKSWSDIKVQNPNTNIVWGAAYWQYFEDLDKIRDFKKTPLTIVKQVFREENSPTGPKLTALSDGNRLKPGDKLKVRVEIRVDRPMEYVHLKDMRAAGFEPTNVISGYRYQGGLGYYESTRDLATHFFIDYLPRGTFVFEYPLVVNLKGDFSNGITTIQCMYAPEFASHSKGIRVRVE